MNGVRFAIALVLCLLSILSLSQRKYLTFFIYIFIASLFHKSSLLCLSFFLLINFQNKKINLIRNVCLIGSIFLFVGALPFLFKTLASFPYFSRYFIKYGTSTKNLNFNMKWGMHIFPVIIPFILFYKRIKSENKNEFYFYFKVCITEIFFRMLALVNPFLGRLARFSQICQVVCVPFFISSLENKLYKKLCMVYYLCWYTFYFFYYLLFTFTF